MHLVSPDEVAAIVVEPIQGEGGYVVPPPVFHQRLREIASQHGILLVADEVQSGMGRTGKMFAIEHFGVEPDIVATAKGIASGMPLGVCTARAEVMAWPPGAHASTFGGNPVSCAAAIATIELLQRELCRNAEHGRRVPARGRAGADGQASAHRRRARQGPDDRHRAACGIAQTKERAVEERDDVVDAAFYRGLLVLGAGKNTIRLSPPLVLTRAQAETALQILDEAFTEVETKRGIRETGAESDDRG